MSMIRVREEIGNKRQFAIGLTYAAVQNREKPWRLHVAKPQDEGLVEFYASKREAQIAATRIAADAIGLMLGTDLLPNTIKQKAIDA